MAKRDIPQSDLDLVNAVHRGDYQAFRDVYDQYWQSLLSYTKHLVRSDADAEDIVQEVFIQFWKSSQIEKIESLQGYFRTALRFRILKHFEKTKVRSQYTQALEAFKSSIAESDVSENLELKELSERIEAEIGKLPKKMREIFYLRKFQFLSYKEIAETLEISESTVKKQLNNATKLKERFVDRSLPLILFFY